jgi:hypothetical protein
VELFVDRLVTLLPQGYVLTSYLEISLLTLAPHPFMLFQRGGAPDLFDQLVSVFLCAGFPPDLGPAQLDTGRSESGRIEAATTAFLTFLGERRTGIRKKMELGGAPTSD